MVRGNLKTLGSVLSSSRQEKSKSLEPKRNPSPHEGMKYSALCFYGLPRKRAVESGVVFHVEHNKKKELTN